MTDIPQGRVRRVVPLITLTGRNAGDLIVSNLQQRVRGAQPDHTAHLRAAERYVELLGRSRGVLMKAGQILSFMGVVDEETAGIPAVYRTALARLQAQAPPMKAAEARRVITTELGMPVESLFAEFEGEAFAAASIGQVHRARMPDGRRVAVKVQYPGVEQTIRADLANVSLLTTFVRLGGSVLPGLPQLDPEMLAEEIRIRIGEEIDYGIEAANQREFADHYRGHPFIHIPEVVEERSSQRVLTMDYVEGMTWEEALKQPQELHDRWGEVLQRFVWGGIRRTGLTNTDPHPGNYLFHDNGAITFLDFGSVKRFTPNQVRLIARMERCGVSGDNAGLMKACADAGFITNPAEIAPDAVAAWLSTIWLPMTAEQPFTYSPEGATTTARDVLTPFGPHGDVLRRMELPPDFVFFLRMDAGVTAIMGALRATGQWRALSDELDRVGAPATEMGRLEQEFFADTPRLVDVPS